MSPTIRVDDDVYDRLKNEAEPFVDTPNSVLRRMLDLPASRNGSSAEGEAEQQTFDEGRQASAPSAGKKKRSRSKSKGRQRAVRGTLVPQAAYELPILQVLAEKGGRAPSREVIDALEPLMKDRLQEVDRSKTSSGEIRWRNRAQFVRLSLIEKGEMVKDSPRGVWEITDDGKQRVAKT